MIILKPRAKLLYLSAVDRCQTGGAILTAEDYIWLYEASKKVTREDARNCPNFLDATVNVHGLILYPMTIGAMCWWRQYGEGFFAGGNESEILAIAYCMARAKNPEAFASLNSKSAASTALVAWQLGIPAKCTLAELSWGIDRVQGNRDPVEIHSVNQAAINHSAADWGELVARLCMLTGYTPDYVLWQLSEKAALELLDRSPEIKGSDKSEAIETTQAKTELNEIVLHLIKTRKAA